ncbi:hypothetical protein JMF97_06970 [Micromonospora fiedleri]|uniref:Uncharacterized protein n=1 Tax=Micromonospora fiedleri TaxID=1157498 RepID=A0ABS1UHV0_9ACTN|nr:MULTISPECIES: hypothetical protein [Micromonospora]MBL6275898.1 hypothetical protein [Micromonospora fiedleri]WSK42003.1 hypothetical protein OG712_26540 [Micromonospora maris]
MAQGDAEYGCAQDEPSRPGAHEQPATAKHHHHRRPTGLSQPADAHAGWTPERCDEEPAVARPGPTEPVVPRQRAAEPPVEPVEPDASGCRSERPGWAGAHRHGPVRPARRATRRERPPRRWC